MDDKTRTRQIELTDLVSGFCGKYLDEEYEDLCLRLVEKLDVNVKRPSKGVKLKTGQAVWYTLLVSSIFSLMIRSTPT